MSRGLSCGVVLIASVFVVASVSSQPTEPAEAVTPKAPKADEPVSFQNHIAGILQVRCGSCHIEESRGRINFASFEKLTERGGMIRVSRPERSALVKSVRSGSMPPKEKMPEAEIEAIRRWVTEGAKFDGPSRTAILSTYSGIAPDVKKP